MSGACACLGPQNGEPYCPCRMRREGLPSNAESDAILDSIYRDHLIDLGFTPEEAGQIMADPSMWEHQPEEKDKDDYLVTIDPAVPGSECEVIGRMVDGVLTDVFVRELKR